MKTMIELSIRLDSSVCNRQFNDQAPDLQGQNQDPFRRIRTDRGIQVFLADVVLQEPGNAPVSASRNCTHTIENCWWATKGVAS